MVIATTTSEDVVVETPATNAVAHRPGARPTRQCRWQKISNSPRSRRRARAILFSSALLYLLPSIDLIATRRTGGEEKVCETGLVEDRGAIVELELVGRHLF